MKLDENTQRTIDTGPNGGGGGDGDVGELGCLPALLSPPGRLTLLVSEPET
jgi:hypothetical protein